MRAADRIAFVLTLALFAACADPDSGRETKPAAQECGGCALPPRCNADGTSPPAGKCSCGCLTGLVIADGMCTAAGCIGPLPEAGAGDGG